MRGGLPNDARDEPQAASPSASPPLPAQPGFVSLRTRACCRPGAAGFFPVVDEQPENRLALKPFRAPKSRGILNNNLIASRFGLAKGMAIFRQMLPAHHGIHHSRVQQVAGAVLPGSRFIWRVAATCSDQPVSRRHRCQPAMARRSGRQRAGQIPARRRRRPGRARNRAASRQLLSVSLPG